MLVAGLAMFTLTNIYGELWLGIVLNTLMAIPASFRFVSGNALVSELVPTARGTMTAMNSSANQVGTMTGSAVGGLTIEITGGYGLLGLTFGGTVDPWSYSAALIRSSKVVTMPFLIQHDELSLENIESTTRRCFISILSHSSELKFATL